MGIRSIHVSEQRAILFQQDLIDFDSFLAIFNKTNVDIIKGITMKLITDETNQTDDSGLLAVGHLCLMIPHRCSHSGQMIW